MKGRLNIGILCYPTYGGSGVVATELGKELADRGHRVHFISYDIPFRLMEYHPNIFYHGVDPMDYPLFQYPLYSISLANKIAAIIEQANLDIIHAHYAIPHSICGYLGILISKKTNTKLITTLHGTDITLVGRDESFKRITKFGIENSDAVTSVSNNLKWETMEHFGIDDKKIKVIYNFVNPKHFENINKEPYGEKTIIHISNFREVKNIETLIKVFYETQKKINCRLKLVGEGPELSKAQRLIAELGIGDKVDFLGKQNEVLPILAKSHLFLLPSLKESFGLVALEAMGCGIPVVASDVGGLPEVVERDICGYLYSPLDIDSMIKGCIKILSDDILAKQLGLAGQKIAFEKFNSNDKIQEYEELYYTTLERS